ncbi:hypothetical protein [Anaerocellum danielii]|uniref:Uncharacterized protein n=1 Tax=Anaerocellum danielii TaxID=1387557 RepID=A0ABZ0TXK3_9FIRM|nr:hypothetical protein [Caldicellulosiruptor danielii]WPX08155.1 hypothetical protein SOJ16_002021 [Caldicellulosiruptor danielii]
MKELLYYISMIAAGLGLGIYVACAILYSSAVPFDAMKKQNVVKLGLIKSVFWLIVVLTAALIVIAQLIK